MLCYANFSYKKDKIIFSLAYLIYFFAYLSFLACSPLFSVDVSNAAQLENAISSGETSHFFLLMKPISLLFFRLMILQLS